LARFEAPLVFELRASRGFRAGLALAVAAAVGAVLLSDLPRALAVVLVGFALFVGGRAWRAQERLSGLFLRLSADDAIDWRRPDGVEGHGRLCDHARLGPLAALTARATDGRLHRFAVWRDMLEPDGWRRLNAALARRGAADSYKS
jgi:hypothetical protein